MMKPVDIGLIMVVAFLPFLAHGETTFTNSTVESADRDARQLPIRTGDGQSWSLPVHSVALLTGIQKGDRVSLEIGPDVGSGRL